jgi:hypothetical protein
LIVSVAAVDPAPLATAALLAAIAIHGIAAFPGNVDVLVLASDGTWSLPRRQLFGLRLAGGSNWGAWWAELVLAGPQLRVRVLLLRDQLPAEDWRRLQVAMRESNGCAAAGRDVP